MKGDGAIDNPWIPDTVQEFRTACSQQGYVKLGKDLDCNQDGYYEWTALDVVANEVDFNGFALKNPYIANGGFLMNAYAGNNKIKNGKILNIYENGANRILESMAIEKMAISASCNNIKNVMFNYCQINFCNIFVKRNSTYLGSLCNLGNIENSRIEIDATFSGTSPGQLSNPVFSGTGIESSLVTGNADLTVPENWLTFLSYGDYSCILNNSICNLKQSGTTLYFPGMYDDIVVNLDNAKSVQFNRDNTKVKTVTDEQLRNPDYLNSIGFNVVKV